MKYVIVSNIAPYIIQVARGRCKTKHNFRVCINCKRLVLWVNEMKHLSPATNWIAMTVSKWKWCRSFWHFCSTTTSKTVRQYQTTQTRNTNSRSYFSGWKRFTWIDFMRIQKPLFSISYFSKRRKKSSLVSETQTKSYCKFQNKKMDGNTSEISIKTSKIYN